MVKVKPIPEGYSTLTPSLILKDTAKAIDFYKSAFGAQERLRMPGPDKKVMHAEIAIGSSIVMLADEMYGNRSAETLGASPISFYVYVEDVDAAFRKAIAAGAKETMAVEDMFWGDRVGQVQDPFGYKWMIATHKRELTPEEIKKGQEEWTKQMAGAH